MASNQIAALNDQFRTTFSGGKVVMTATFSVLPETIREQAIKAVQNFSKFEKDNDPYGEHDFGAFCVGDENFFWKIDYYNNDMSSASPNPADRTVTLRVLTIMCEEDY